MTGTAGDGCAEHPEANTGWWLAAQNRTAWKTLGLHVYAVEFPAWRLFLHLYMQNGFFGDGWQARAFFRCANHPVSVLIS